MQLGPKSYGLRDVETQGDKAIFHHIQYVDHIKKSVADLRKINETGMSEKKEMQHIGRIPFLTWEANKEKFCPGGVIDEKAICRWLNTPEGEPYRTTQKML